MRSAVAVLVVALAYLALAGLSAWFAFEQADSWTVWLASAVTLGVLLVRPRPQWWPVLLGAALGATLFDLALGGPLAEALGYGLIEAATGFAGAWLAARITGLPARIDDLRRLTAFVLGGVGVQSLLGAALATAWHVATDGRAPAETFRVWLIANVVGGLLVAPVIVSWAGFRPKRSGGLTMPQFAFGAVCAVLLLGKIALLFNAGFMERFEGSFGVSFTYPPILLMALLALAWGMRGATLTALVAALLMIARTRDAHGPFAALEGFVGEAVLEAQSYAAAIALTGMLIAALAASQREAWRAARDWRTRFEATINAHGLVAYEWDPASGRLTFTGDTRALVGVPPERLATLADWMDCVVADEREAVGRAFAARSEGGVDTVGYHVAGAAGVPVGVKDEARAIRDHDGTLHRVVGIVRTAAA